MVTGCSWRISPNRSIPSEAWSQARAEGSQSAIEGYLERFPGGRHEAEALIRLEEFRLAAEAEQRARDEQARQERETWEDARTEGTVAALDRYLADWPAGTFANEARALRKSLQDAANESRAFDAARKLNTIDAYQSYVDAFPRGAHLAAALESIDSLTLRPGKTFRDCPECPTMVVVPAGSFWQGSEESSLDALKLETPPRMVSIAEPFAVGVFEVTFCAWPRAAAPRTPGTMAGGATRDRSFWFRGTTPWNSPPGSAPGPASPTGCPAKASGSMSRGPAKRGTGWAAIRCVPASTAISPAPRPGFAGNMLPAATRRGWRPCPSDR
jgi:hypothetical protein